MTRAKSRSPLALIFPDYLTAENGMPDRVDGSLGVQLADCNTRGYEPVFDAMAKVALIITSVFVAQPAYSHPHVFVDGVIDFRFSKGTSLEAIEVTWLYDEFETLYMLSAAGISLNAEGLLDEEDRLALKRERSKWPSDFDGSAHIVFKE